MTNKVDCIGLRESQTRGSHDDDFGDTPPNAENLVSEGKDVGSDRMTHGFFRGELFVPVLSEQQQTGSHTPERSDDGEVTGKLCQGASMVSTINAWYGQESHIGGQQHSGLYE